MAGRNMQQRVREFNELSNCFSELRPPKDWQVIFGNEHPINLELGCGKAEVSVALASLHPEHNFVGVDLKATRLWRPAKTALANNQTNLAFLQLHILTLGEFFADNSVDSIWITFPDPYPKARQAKHRMLNNNFLDLYKQLLKPGGSVNFKTDNLKLFEYCLEVLAERPDITTHELSFDLHNSDLPAATKIETTYEKKFRAMGETINYVQFTFS